MPEPAPLHPVSRVHLDVLTDEIGIMQHAIGSRPDPAHGYCTDDVARALQVDLLHQRELGWPAVADSAWRNLRLPRRGLRRVRRVASATSAAWTGSWLDGAASEDSQGRAMLALGEAIATAPDPAMIADARRRCSRGPCRRRREFTALRAQASVLLGCDAAMRRCAEPDRSSAAYRHRWPVGSARRSRPARLRRGRGRSRADVRERPAASRR